MNRLPLIVACGFAAAFALAPAPARAVSYHDTSGGGSCHPAASGPSTFARGNNYITNVGTTSQYVICSLAHDDDSLTPAPTGYFYVHISSTQSSRTVTCSAQTGGWYNGSNYLRSSVAKTYTFASPGYTSLSWTPSTLVRTNPWDVLTLNCRLDPGTRVGLIEWRED